MITILQGDCIEQMKTMPEKSVQCVVTSPPYWGLRDYGTATWEGGSQECDHKQGRPGAGRADGIVDERSQRNRDGVGSMGGDCKKCGAIRIDKQIGLEPTPREFVEKMVAVFAEVWRVLKDDGVIWVNLGDSYAANRTYQVPSTKGGVKHGPAQGCEGNGSTVPEGLKPKDLVGIPWRVAFALQEAGWYLRSDIIWSKPNPMPESVTDRPTKAHEYIFLLSKNERYFYDADAIKEPVNGGAHARTPGNKGHKHTSAYEDGDERHRTKAGLVDYAAKVRAKNNTSFNDAMAVMPDVRNKRSVWTVPSAPYKEAHFATYPPDLIKPCILAGSRPGDMILDPFGGSGCTGMVANELGRDCTLIELNPEYVKLIERRTDTTPGLGL